MSGNTATRLTMTNNSLARLCFFIGMDQIGMVPSVIPVSCSSEVGALGMDAQHHGEIIRWRFSPIPMAS